MKLKFSIDYSEEERAVIEAYHFHIMPEIALSKIAFSEAETPRRMLEYGGCYFVEIPDDEEEDQFVWAMLSKNRKGAYHFTSCFESLQNIVEGL